MSDWTDSPKCKCRLVCNACRTMPEWGKARGVPKVCPHGITADSLPTVKKSLTVDHISDTGKKVGDHIARARKKIRGADGASYCLAAVKGCCGEPPTCQASGAICTDPYAQDCSMRPGKG